MKKLLLFFLCFALLISSSAGLLSCQTGGKQKTETTNAQSNATGGGETETVAPENDLFADLKTVNYSKNGLATEFTIYSNYVEASNSVGIMDTDDVTTTFSSAVYSRNRFVEEQLGVMIQWKYDAYGTVSNALPNIHASGDYPYDIVYNESYIQQQAVLKGIYKSANDYSKYLDFDKPWWYSDILESLTVADNLFLLAGALNLTVDDMMWCVGFNAKIISDFGAQSPFDYVYDNEWTWENFYKLSQDTRAEGKYGITGIYAFVDALMFGSGLTLLSKNEDGELIRSTVDDRFVTLYQELQTKFLTSNGVGAEYENCMRPYFSAESYQNFAPWPNFMDVFTGGNATFTVGVTGNMRMSLPMSEISYGIVPSPKYNSEQETYCSNMSRPAGCGGILENQPNESLERVCTVWEWLSAYSHKLVRPVYYDVIMLGRVPRQEETSEMLNIIFGLDERGKIVVELDTVFDTQMVVLLEDGAFDLRPDIAGIMRSNAKTVDSKIETIYEFYRSN